MNFLFVCWWCGEEFVAWAEPVGFWTTRYRLPGELECWNCGATNTTPDPPWTPAD